MSQILFRGTSIEKKATVGFSIFIVLGIVGIVLAVILLVAGRRAPDEAEVVMIIAGPVGLVSMLIGIWKFFAVRGDVFITKAGNKYGITLVNSKKQKVVELFSPFAVRCYSEYYNAGKGQKGFLLYLLVQNEEGNTLLCLTSGQHVVMGKPEGWEEIGGIDLSGVERIYTCSHIADAAKVLRPFVKKA